VKRTLEVLNELEREGVFSRYAIGGAMAATFYVEPLLTFDLDVFILLEPSTSGLISLTVIYQALRARGYTEENECVLIEDVPVQFLPAYNSLVEDALVQAREIDYDGVRTRVVRAEHLVAICLQTGRDKDRERMRLLRTQGELEAGYLADLLRRYNLEEKWKTWTE
jgi:predicted nucleotidyltransferase